MFLIRFQSQHDRIRACEMNGILFDKKPFIVKPWTSSMSYSKDHLSSLPIWVKFPGLDVRYWGEKSLTKIASMIGPILRVDGATTNKDRMMYARVLVDVNVSQGLYDELFFENEHGELISQKVEYVWKPLRCNRCAQFGHLDSACRVGTASVVQHKHAEDNESF